MNKSVSSRGINLFLAILCLLTLLIAWLIPSSASSSAVKTPNISLFDMLDFYSALVVCLLSFLGVLLAGFTRKYSLRFVGHALSLTVFSVGVYIVDLIRKTNDLALYDDDLIISHGANALVAFGVFELIWFIVTIFFSVTKGNINLGFSPRIAPRRWTPTPTTSSTPEAKFERLKKLHESGLLTDEEFETKRKGIVDEL